MKIKAVGKTPAIAARPARMTMNGSMGVGMTLSRSAATRHQGEAHRRYPTEPSERCPTTAASP
jgi:hypothetical protein